MPLLILIVALAQAADAVTFAIGVPVVGIHAELNPLARAAFDTGGMALALALKAALALILCSLVAMYRRHGWRQAGLVVVAGGMGVLGTVGNVFATIHH